MVRTGIVAFAIASSLALTACGTDGPLSVEEQSAALGRGSDRDADRDRTTGTNVRVRCELRSGRSKVSVDGKDLRPAGGLFSARIASGAHSAAAPARRAVGDEVEFDFDSDRGDIAEGATAIAPDFIVIGAGPDVTAEVLDAAGTVVATGKADCEVK